MKSEINQILIGSTISLKYDSNKNSIKLYVGTLPYPNRFSIPNNFPVLVQDNNFYYRFLIAEDYNHFYFSKILLLEKLNSKNLNFYAK